MNHLTPLFDSAWVQALGWTLLHSLWQGVVLALLLAAALIILRRQSANVRYLAGVFTLIALLICMSFTFTLFYTPNPGAELINDPASTTFYAYDESENAAPFSPEADDSIEENASLSYVLEAYFEEHMPFLMLLYLIGVLILTMRMLGELVYLQNLCCSRSLVVSEVWQEKLYKMAQCLKISTPVALKESLWVSSPMIVGFLRPVIFMPVGLLTNLPSNQIESILAHELAHIRRHDYLINLIQSFVEILLFFNPAVWWISNFIRSEREHCCDDLAIKLTGDELTFARTLANLEEWRSRNGRLAVAFSGKRSNGVLGRIQRLLEKKESTQLPFRLFWSALILSAGLLLVAFSSNDASPSKNNPAEFEMESTDAASPASPAYQADYSEQAINSNDESDFVSNEGIENFELEEMDQLVNDTTPESIRKLKMEIQELEQSFALKREGLHKQMRELELKRYAFDKEIQKQDFNTQSAALELEKELQRIEKEKMMQARELELQITNQEQAVLEMQYRIRELELQLEFKNDELSENENDEKLKNEINKIKKEIQELRKTTLLRKQEKHKRELEVRREAILKEKEMQEMMYKNQLNEFENQIKAHSKETEMLSLEESMRQLEFQMEELENEFQNQMEALEHQLETEYEKTEQEEY